MISLKNKLLPLALCTLSLASVACNDPLDPSSRVNDLRVLAVQADEPYAHPGDTVQLNALGVDPRERTLTWGWTTCVNPDDSTALSCLDSLRRRAENGEDIEMTTGEGLDHFEIPVDDGAITSLPDEFRDRAMIGVVTVLCPGTLEPRIGSDVSNEHPLPIVCRDPGTGDRLGPFDFITGVKRLFVREEDRNANPEIARITFDGKDWAEDDVLTVDNPCNTATNKIDDCPERTHHEIAAFAADGATESGTDENGNRFDEQVVVQYYATAGTFQDDVRVDSDPKTKWAASSESIGKELMFWFVIRDNRGGVSWVTRTLRVDG